MNVLSIVIRRCRRARIQAANVLKGAVEPVVTRWLTPERLRSLGRVPSLPSWFRRRYAAVHGSWPSFEAEIPTELRGEPGIVRDAVLERAAFEEEPLHSFHHNYGGSVNWALGRLWQATVPVGPRLMRAIATAQATARATPGGATQDAQPTDLTAEVRRAAADVGISTIGIAAYDEKYTFSDLADDLKPPLRVIVCILEQNWKATQLIPGPVSEQTALSTNAELMEMTARLAGVLHSLGYPARAHTTEGMTIVHHYGVEAGLGQLGINGQLLTPQAGSRCRIAVITTDAPLVADAPRDFGIPAICDKCRACVRRCPSGAIPVKRTMHRGVEKAKLNLGRCFPVVAQVDGCSVCMKVCPVQRYGLGPVLDHYGETGEIIGTGSDELEGYVWPLDGRHYGPDERPKLAPEFFLVPGFDGKPKSGPAPSNPLM